MKLVIVEDDYLQSDLIISELSAKLGFNDILLIETEADFISSVQKMENNPPNIILLDIMLRWTDPAPNMPEPPPDVKEEGFYNAGFRCQQLISSNPKFRNTHIIFYSVLDKFDLTEKLENLPRNVSHFPKDKEISALVLHIRRLINLPEVR